jgi:hypothetical protein
MNTTRTQLTLAAGAALGASLSFALFDSEDATDIDGPLLNELVQW